MILISQTHYEGGEIITIDERKWCVENPDRQGDPSILCDGTFYLCEQYGAKFKTKLKGKITCRRCIDIIEKIQEIKGLKL